MADVRMFFEECLQSLDVFLRLVRVNEYRVDRTSRAVIFDIVEKSVAALSVRICFVTGVTDQPDQCDFTYIASGREQEGTKCSALIRVYAIVQQVVNIVYLIVYECVWNVVAFQRVCKFRYGFLEYSIHYDS